jgi:hypothetical protein
MQEEGLPQFIAILASTAIIVGVIIAAAVLVVALMTPAQ